MNLKWCHGHPYNYTCYLVGNEKWTGTAMESQPKHHSGQCYWQSYNDITGDKCACPCSSHICISLWPAARSLKKPGQNTVTVEYSQPRVYSWREPCECWEGGVILALIVNVNSDNVEIRFFLYNSISAWIGLTFGLWILRKINKSPKSRNTSIWRCNS